MGTRTSFLVAISSMEAMKECMAMEVTKKNRYHSMPCNMLEGTI
jgi:hypothetical protein